MAGENVAKQELLYTKPGKVSFVIPCIAFSEYIDYHLSPETMTPPPNAPLILNGGDGDSGGWGSNVTAQLGAKAQLHCLVHNRQDKTVRRQVARGISL